MIQNELNNLNSNLSAGIKFDDVLGSDTYSPSVLEESRPDLFWYGIHGVEILYAFMQAADVSKERDGEAVTIEEVLTQARGA